MNRPLHTRIVAARRGGPEVLRPVREELPEPGPGEARVKVLAAGVSGYDLLMRARRLPGSPAGPFTPGEDFVGVVDAVGDLVAEVEAGERVAAWTFGRSGGYSEYICAPADQLIPVPPELDDAEAVAMVVNYLTSHLYMYQTAEVQSGERILVHGASGGIGTALLQLGSLSGLEMYGTASAPNLDLVASLGATPIDYRNDDFVARLRDLTAAGVDVVFDPIGGARQLWRSYRALRRGGRLVMMGSVGATRTGLATIPLGLAVIGMLKLLPDGKRLPLSPSMTKYPRQHMDWYRRTLAELLDYVAAGKIHPVIAARIPLEAAAAAHELLERGGHRGKVVLVAGS